MNKNIISSIFLFVAMVFLQIICNRICLFNVAVPFVFIYFILRLPMTLSVNWVMTLSFIIGFVIDIFGNTYGMHSFACTLLGAMRKPIFNLFYPREDEMSNPIPSIKTLGIGNYVKYLSTLTMLYCTIIFLVQLFTFNNFGLTFLRIVCSTILTSIIIFGFDSLATTNREKRL